MGQHLVSLRNHIGQHFANSGTCFLPFSADSHVASLVMGSDRVSAGPAMIQSADQGRGRDITTGGWVYETNRATMDRCIADMFQTKKEQRCVLTLPVVTAPGE
jgi:hypothetical protein